MRSAHYYDKAGRVRGATDYCRDVATSSSIGRFPLLPDPYEQCWSLAAAGGLCSHSLIGINAAMVFAAPSTVPNSGEGLFALGPLAAGVICALYNGLRLTHAVVDSRGWELNANTISLVRCQFGYFSRSSAWAANRNAGRRTTAS
jgi:hypothetical protein